MTHLISVLTFDIFIDKKEVSNMTRHKHLTSMTGIGIEVLMIGFIALMMFSNGRLVWRKVS